jgi:hypothetical protein
VQAEPPRARFVCMSQACRSEAGIRVAGRAEDVPPLEEHILAGKLDVVAGLVWAVQGTVSFRSQLTSVVATAADSRLVRSSSTLRYCTSVLVVLLLATALIRFTSKPPDHARLAYARPATPHASQVRPPSIVERGSSPAKLRRQFACQREERARHQLPSAPTESGDALVGDEIVVCASRPYRVAYGEHVVGDGQFSAPASDVGIDREIQDSAAACDISAGDRHLGAPVRISARSQACAAFSVHAASAVGAGDGVAVGGPDWAERTGVRVLTSASKDAYQAGGGSPHMASSRSHMIGESRFSLISKMARARIRPRPRTIRGRSAASHHGHGVRPVM